MIIETRLPKQEKAEVIVFAKKYSVTRLANDRWTEVNPAYVQAVIFFHRALNLFVRLLLETDRALVADRKDKTLYVFNSWYFTPNRKEEDVSPFILDFRKAINSPVLSDMTLIVGEEGKAQEIPAHKVPTQLPVSFRVSSDMPSFKN